MFRRVWEYLRENVFNKRNARLFVLAVLVIGIGGYLIYTVFQLQIVNGADYAENFELKITRERSLPATRGSIYDRNGVLLAYDELAYSVTIEDVYESGSQKNANLNNTIYQLIKLIERNGDSIVSDFSIYLDGNGNYKFGVEGTQLLRFLADVYGHASTDDLLEKEKNATAEDIVDLLCSSSRYGIGGYTDENDSSTFVAGLGYTKAEVLQILTIRYAMSANSYQKYIATTVANNVSEETVAVVMENSDVLEGVSISEDTVRRYNDSIYFAHILGYTGKISTEELETLQEIDESYTANDTVGKSGIEASMETYLQGKKGSETLYVDNLGKVIETSDRTEAVAGNDVYLTIDADLQITCYNILEASLANILAAKISNIKEYVATENSSSGNIVIPIYDVYYACINNNILDTSHFSARDAGETEREVASAYQEKKALVFDTLQEELTETSTPYEDLSKEYQAYESYIVSLLYDEGLIDESAIDKTDATYLAWTREETISLETYLDYCIAKNWVDVSRLGSLSQYADSQEIYEKLLDSLFSLLDTDADFEKRIYRYMLNNDEITGKQICLLLLEQDIVTVEDSEYESLLSGSESAYTFMLNRIKNLDITPAQLALDPYSGSIIITDVNTGDVLALVSYPSYDNNKMANGVDATYYAKLRSDLSYPLLNYATQQKTAPGSTFKMVSATAALMEGVVGIRDTIRCEGIFEKITPEPRCWIYSSGGGSHGSLNIAGAIKNSCNYFFYEVGYRLGSTGDSYDSDLGLSKLAYYADLYGLSETTGVEIEESEPDVSDTDAVRSAIGQGTNNYTAIGLARYVTTVANSGTCYNLTLVDKITDPTTDTLVKDNEAEVRNVIEMDDSYWSAIHSGMRQVVESKSYYSDMTAVAIAGKTGTAQESTSRPNHALFVSYAPYEDPEISVVVRVANGYTSDYAAQIAKEVYRYYYGIEEEEDILTGITDTLEGGAANGD